MTSRPVCYLALFAAPALLVACGSLTSSPDWVGGGLATEGPLRHAAEDAKADVERKRLATMPNEIGAKHILIMSLDSKSKPDNVTRTRAEARKRAEEVLAKIRAGANFDDLVKQYSDEPGAGERGGDLGVFDHSSMVKPFAEAAFALKVGEVSDIVETQFGFHIIKRTE